MAAAITAEQLADALHMALHAGRFGGAVEKRLHTVLDAWDAQQGRGERMANIIRDDPDYAALALSQMPAAEQERETRAYANFLRLYGIRDVQAGRGNGTDHSTHPATIGGSTDYTTYSQSDAAG